MVQDIRKGRWQLWVGLLVGIACLAAVFIFFASPREILQILSEVHYGYLALGALGIVMFLVLRAVRWRMMLGHEAPYDQVFHIQNIGYMLTQLLPLRLGDVARAILIGNVPPITIAQGVSTMVVERLLDMLLIVVVLPFTVSGIASLPDWMRSFAIVSGIIAFAGILLLVFAANQRERATRFVDRLLVRFLPFLNRSAWVQRFDRLLAGLRSLSSPREGLTLAALSILIWIPVLVAYYCIMKSVYLVPTWPMAGFVMCAAAFSVAVPSTPGQAGPYHIAVTAALQLYGQPAAQSAAFAFLYHGLTVVVMVILGGIGILGTGVTFRHVLDSVQSFLSRQRAGQST